MPTACIGNLAASGPGIGGCADAATPQAATMATANGLTGPNLQLMQLIRASNCALLSPTGPLTVPGYSPPRRTIRMVLARVVASRTAGFMIDPAAHHLFKLCVS